MIVINAENMILGRMSTVAAKQALLGEEVVIVNCEKAIVSGNRDVLLQKYFSKWKKGIPLKGPYVSRLPDRLVRRTVRGILPWKFTKGREAFKRVMCHIGVPEQYKNATFIEIKGAHAEKLVNVSTYQLGEICKLIGAKI